MVFPDGRLPSPRWRPLAWAFVAGLVASGLRPTFGAGPIGDTGQANPLGVPALAPILALADSLATLLAVPILIGTVAAVAVRFRRGDPVEREQLKWLLAVTGIAAVAFAVALVTQLAGADLASTAAWLVAFFAIIALPVAIAIAVLKYRLYEIDRIISRTISYLVLTAILASIFVTTVLLFTAVLAPVFGENPVAVAASTLIVAALFQPLRSRVQRIVDRRFNRARYDADQIASAFSDRLRDEVDIAPLLGELDATVRRAIAPVQLRIWLREPQDGLR